MKNNRLIVILLAIVILTSCNLISVKGKWTASDKLEVYEEAKKLDWTGMEVVQSKLIDCYVSKLEQNYSSPSDAANDITGCKKIITDCACDIINNTSIKGKWCESDKAQFLMEIEKVSQLNRFGKKMPQIIDLILKKAEENYSSFSEFNSDDEGSKAISKECFQEFFKNNSIKGNWCNVDKQKYYEMLKNEDLSSLGENKNNFIETYLSVLETNYYSIEDANNDPKGTEKLAKECIKSMVN